MLPNNFPFRISANTRYVVSTCLLYVGHGLLLTQTSIIDKRLDQADFLWPAYLCLIGGVLLHPGTLGLGFVPRESQRDFVATLRANLSPNVQVAVAMRTVFSLSAALIPRVLNIPQQALAPHNFSHFSIDMMSALQGGGMVLLMQRSFMPLQRYAIENIAQRKNLASAICALVQCYLLLRAAFLVEADGIFTLAPHWLIGGTGVYLWPKRSILHDTVGYSIRVKQVFLLLAGLRGASWDVWERPTHYLASLCGLGFYALHMHRGYPDHPFRQEYYWIYLTPWLASLVIDQLIPRAVSTFVLPHAMPIGVVPVAAVHVAVHAVAHAARRPARHAARRAALHAAAHANSLPAPPHANLPGANLAPFAAPPAAHAATHVFDDKKSLGQRLRNRFAREPDPLAPIGAVQVDRAAPVAPIAPIGAIGAMGAMGVPRPFSPAMAVPVDFSELNTVGNAPGGPPIALIFTVAPMPTPFTPNPYRPAPPRPALRHLHDQKPTPKGPSPYQSPYQSPNQSPNQNSKRDAPSRDT